MNRVIQLLTFVVVSTPILAFAQNKAAQETTITGGTLVVAAYFSLWAMLLIYLGVLSGRQKRIDDEIAGLEKRLDNLLGVDDAGA